MTQYIDVSKFQGTIDWDKVKATGIDGVIIRAVSTNSNGLYKDEYFERNYAECKRVGLPVGAYYYTYATSTAYADRELRLFKECLDGKQFELPIIFDVEDKTLTKLSKKALTDLTIYALDTIESWGCYRMYYTGQVYGNTYLDENRLINRYDKWLAFWTANKPAGKYGIWQYTNSGSVSGINGRVDMSYAYKDYPAMIKAAGLNGFEKPAEPIAEPEPEPVPDPEPVPEPTPEPITEPVEPGNSDFTEDEVSFIVKLIRLLIKLIGGLEK